MNAKYELVLTDTKQHFGKTLYRIRALVEIGAIVSAGDLGGYVEYEKNLSLSGDAWVSGDAQVYGNAQVYGDALVYGDARVFGNARVYGDARVLSTTDYLIVGPAKSSYRFTTAYKDSKIGVRVSCGCFTGTVKEFSDAVEKTHAGNKEHLEQYRLFVQLIAFNFG